MGYVTQTCLEAPHSSNTLCFVIQVRIISYMATLYKRLIVCSKICFGLKREHSHRSKHTTHLNDKRIWFICNTASHTVHTRRIYPPYSSPTPTKPIRVCVRSACLPSMLKSQCVTEATHRGFRRCDVPFISVRRGSVRVLIGSLVSVITKADLRRSLAPG